MLKEFLIRLFGEYKGKTHITKGAFKGTYNVYRFLGNTYEFKIDKD